MSVENTTPRPGKRRTLVLAVIGLIGLCIAGIAIAALDRAMRLRRDEQTIKWAEDAMREGRYDDAAAQYARAVARHPDSAELSLKSGDAYYALSATRLEALQKAKVAWESAARLDPKNLAPLQRLLRLQLALADVRPVPTVFNSLGDLARKVMALSPQDKDAETASLIAPLGAWFSQTEPGTAFQDEAHDQLVTSLGAALRQNDADARAVLYFALASSRRAVELKAQRANDRARQVLDKAEAEVVRSGDANRAQLCSSAEAMKVLYEANVRLEEVSPAADATTRPATTQPVVALRLWPTWDIIDQQVRWDEDRAPQGGVQVADKATTQPANAAAERCLNEARSLASRAAEAAKPSDPQFIESRMLEVHLAEAAGDLAGAESICRQTVSARPGDLRAELALAELVGRSHPEQALAALSQPEKAPDLVPGPIALVRRGVLIRVSEERARLYLDAASTIDDPAARKADLDKADAACEELAAMLVDDAASLKLTGRLRMMQGRHAEAVRILDRAVAKSPRLVDSDLLWYRATSLLALHDSQRALDNLREALEADPSRTAERVMLAQTLLTEGRLTEAGVQVNSLEKEAKDNPGVAELRVKLLIARAAADNDAASTPSIREAWSKLPETSVRQKISKAELALSAGQAADAIQLLQSTTANGPDAVSVAADLVRAYLAAGQTDRARQTLADALRSHPADAALTAVQHSVDGPPSHDAQEAAVTGDNAKDFISALHEARAALAAHELSRALEQVNRAAKLRPDDSLMAAVKFDCDLARQQWADARVCVDRLTASNFDGKDGLSYLFHWDVARGRPLAALCDARQMTCRFGQASDSWKDLGEALQGLGRYDLAVANFRRAAEMAPDRLAVIKDLASTYEMAGQMQEADRWIAAGRKLAPADSDLREMEFARELDQGDPHRLVGPRKVAVASEPQRPDNVIALARVNLRINALQVLSPKEAPHDSGAGWSVLSNSNDKPSAHQQSDRDALDNAVQTLADAVKRWPDDENCSFWLAHAMAIKGDIADGKQVLRRLCDRTAWVGRPEADEALADFCVIWGDLHGAEGALREAISKGARNATMARRLATVLARMGSWRPALEALGEYPTDALVQQQRVYIFVAAGHAADAEKELQKAQRADPKNGRLMTLLGILYYAENQDDQARTWLDRAIAAGDMELASRARGALSLRGKAADRDSAIRDLLVAHEAIPADLQPALLLSHALVANRQRDRAAQVLETALAMTPDAREVRHELIAVEKGAAAPDWDQIMSLIESGRALAPSDWGWDAVEAQVWSSRHDNMKAAELMKHAVQMAERAPEAVDVTLQGQYAMQARSLIPQELWILLQAQDYSAVNTEADQIIVRYGSGDMLSAWAHQAKAAVQRRTGQGDGGAREYNEALKTAEAASGYPGAAAIIEQISREAGVDEAVRRINAYVASVDASGHSDTSLPLPHDPQWDLRRIDLLRRNGAFPEAAAAVDKMMPQLSALPPVLQNEMLRLAVVVYLQDPASSKTNKARNACLALLERTPDDPWALNNMAAICIDHSNPPDPDKAIEYSAKAYRLLGGTIDPQVADTYGWALASAGRTSEALDVLKPAAERLANPEAYYHLAGAYLAARMPAEAERCLTSALELIRQSEQQGHQVAPNLQTQIADAYWRAIGQDVAQAMGPVFEQPQPSHPPAQ